MESRSPLLPLPDDLLASRLGLHRVGAYLLSPARRHANGRIGLRAMPGGFGTPLFDGGWLRVVGTDVVREVGRERSVVPITTLSEVGSALGVEPDVEWGSQFDIPVAGDLDAPLAVSSEGARALADWFAFGWSILDELRLEDESIDASEPQLWPEHFDPAIEIGSDAEHRRASYGFSPGDVGTDGRPNGEVEPYLYVGPWYPDDRPDSDFWNGDSFPGAVLRYADLLTMDDPRAEAMAFLKQGRELLTPR